MDHTRGRSPSAGHNATHIRHPSASPRPSLPTASTNSFALADDSAGSATHNHSNPSFASGLNAHATSGQFLDPTFTADFSQQAQFGLGPTYSDFSSSQQPLSNISDQALLQSQGLEDVSPGSSAFPAFDFNQSVPFDQSTSLDPSLLNDIDLLASQAGLDTSSNALDPMATMTQSHSPTPPHLFTQDGRRPSGSPSPHASPRFQQAQYAQMNRPRNQSVSLDPSSAMFPQGGNEWMGMGGYRSHKRTPSDQHSDISSNHATSPYMNTLDNFDHSSPLLNPSQDASFNDGLGLQQFSLNDQNGYHSPAHSPGHSPHLMPQPQQALPQFTPDNNFGLSSNSINGHYGQNGGLEMFAGTGQEPFPTLNTESSSPSGRADHMSPPEINIDFAPPSRVPTDNMKVENSTDALSPPLRSKCH